MFGVAHSGENGCAGVTCRDITDSDGNIIGIDGIVRVGTNTGANAGISTNTCADTGASAS